MDSIATFEKNFANFGLTPNSRVTDVRPLQERPVCSLNILFHPFSCHILVKKNYFSAAAGEEIFTGYSYMHTDTVRLTDSHVRRRRGGCAMGP